MIKNDDELGVVLEQLGRVESALESLNRDMLHQNVDLYGLMAMPCVVEIGKLKLEVDEYLRGRARCGDCVFWEGQFPTRVGFSLVYGGMGPISGWARCQVWRAKGPLPKSQGRENQEMQAKDGAGCWCFAPRSK